MKKIEEKGVVIASVTLHVGLGTFRPVKVENVLEHHMHSEFYRIEPEEAEKINAAKKAGIELPQGENKIKTNYIR